MRLKWVAEVRQRDTKILRVVHWNVVGIGNGKEGRKETEGFSYYARIRSLSGIYKSDKNVNKSSK